MNRIEIIKSTGLTQLLCYALGWQGGTVHQVSDATGLDASWIVNVDPLEAAKESHDGDFMGGWWAVRTCGKDYMQDKLIPTRKGDSSFWLGTAAGIADSIAMGESRQGYIAPLREASESVN